jgi:hypothetical protein
VFGVLLLLRQMIPSGESAGSVVFVAIGVAFVATRPPANANQGKTAEPPPQVSAPSSSTMIATPSATSAAPPETTTPPVASSTKPVVTTKPPVAKPPQGTRKSCDPPYDFDSKGLKHFKPECL